MYMQVSPCSTFSPMSKYHAQYNDLLVLSGCTVSNSTAGSGCCHVTQIGGTFAQLSLNVYMILLMYTALLYKSWTLKYLTYHRAKTVFRNQTAFLISTTQQTQPQTWSSPVIFYITVLTLLQSLFQCKHFLFISYICTHNKP